MAVNVSCRYHITASKSGDLYATEKGWEMFHQNRHQLHTESFSPLT